MLPRVAFIKVYEHSDLKILSPKQMVSNSTDTSQMRLYISKLTK